MLVRRELPHALLRPRIRIVCVSGILRQEGMDGALALIKIWVMI
jgi:hypothetical protein